METEVDPVTFTTRMAHDQAAENDRAALQQAQQAFVGLVAAFDATITTITQAKATIADAEAAIARAGADRDVHAAAMGDHLRQHGPQPMTKCGRLVVYQTSDGPGHGWQMFYPTENGTVEA